MPITFSCPCGKKLQVRDEYAGKKATCPGCRQVLEVPWPTPQVADDAIVNTELVDLPAQQFQGGPPPGAVTGAVQCGPFISELPPTPDQLPNHNRDALPEDVDFFAAPPLEIGPLVSGYSNLRRGKEPVSPAVRLVGIFGALIVGLLLMAVFVVLRQPILVIITFGLTLLASSLGWLLTRFAYRCTYVGREGVVKFVTRGGRDNLGTELFLFHHAAELRNSQTRHFYNGAYTGTQYRFTWTDFHGKKVFTLAGMYHDIKGNPKAKDPFHFAAAAESAWSLHLLSEAPHQLEAGGSIRFGLKGADSVRLGAGFLVLTRRGETVRLQGEDIARVRIQQGTVAILEPDAREGWFSSSGVYKFSYGELANAQFFVILMEQLLGVRAST